MLKRKVGEGGRHTAPLSRGLMQPVGGGVLPLHCFILNFATTVSGFGSARPDEELRLREVEELAPDHTAGRGEILGILSTAAVG